LARSADTKQWPCFSEDLGHGGGIRGAWKPSTCKRSRGLQKQNPRLGEKNMSGAPVKHRKSFADGKQKRNDRGKKVSRRAFARERQGGGFQGKVSSSWDSAQRKHRASPEVRWEKREVRKIGILKRTEGSDLVI